MGECQIAIFSLNNQFCGVETSQVQSIIKYQELEKVQRMPKFIEGIINLRDKAVPIISLNRRFELGETKITENTKIVITRINESFAGFMVNNVDEIIHLSDEEIEATPEIICKAGNKFIKGIGKKDEKLINIIDFNRLLTDSEIKMLESKF
jgi:purine-binding chemotaxis protein CheW